MSTTTRTLDAVRVRIVDGMRAYVAAGVRGGARSHATEQIAEALADARELFYDTKGEADILGRSYAYRVFVTGALDEAGVPKADRSNLLSAIRYAISPILHARHGDELQERGLTGLSTRDRSRRRRERELAIIRLFGGGGPITDPDDAEMMAELARAAFNRIRPLGDAEIEHRAAIVDALARAGKAAEAASAQIATSR